eukprot:COSAG04_NODE_227_length_19396_cov_29.887547_12_plen_114_part_00
MRGGDSKRESTGFESDSDSDEDFDPSDEELEIDEVRAEQMICAVSVILVVSALVISTPRLLEARLLVKLGCPLTTDDADVVVRTSSRGGSRPRHCSAEEVCGWVRGVSGKGTM